jgi:hypothetical protein
LALTLESNAVCKIDGVKQEEKGVYHGHEDEVSSQRQNAAADVAQEDAVEATVKVALHMALEP